MLFINRIGYSCVPKPWQDWYKKHLTRKLRYVFKGNYADFSFVIANSALSGGRIEGEIKRKIIEDDLAYWDNCYTTKIVLCSIAPSFYLFFKKSKPVHMKGKVLFIYDMKILSPFPKDMLFSLKST